MGGPESYCNYPMKCKPIYRPVSLPVCGVFRLMNSIQIRQRDFPLLRICPMSNHHKTSTQTHTHIQQPHHFRSVKVTSQNYNPKESDILIAVHPVPVLLMFLCIPEPCVSVLQGGATRTNIDCCSIRSRSLAFLPYQQCPSSDNRHRNTHMHRNPEVRILVIDIIIMQYNISVLWATHLDSDKRKSFLIFVYLILIY